MVKRYRSSIPAGAVERVVTAYKRQGGKAAFGVWLQKNECLLNGTVVGERYYDEDGTLVQETPLKNGQKHGVEFHWNASGALRSAEPYRHGLPHGTARQWGEDGTLLGTYTLKHGAGLDLWRCEDEDGAVYLAEVRSLKNGQRHGFEWCLGSELGTVCIERHWQEGRLHGIEREWNEHGRQRRGFPKYFVKGERVSKRQYLRACKMDSRMPAYRADDDKPLRTFPLAFARELKISRST